MKAAQPEGANWMRILLIEDQRHLAQSIVECLAGFGLNVDLFATADDGLSAAKNVSYDAMILDLGLPDRDEIEVMSELRANGKQIPILRLTARDGVDDSAEGDDCGADDYLLKPFAMKELAARLRVLLRRPGGPFGATTDKAAGADTASNVACLAPYLTVVVPTFNEVANVAILIERLHRALSSLDWEAIFVDDDSPDGTAAEVRRLGETDRRIRCIRRIGRRGLAGACIEGMLATQATYVAIMDADLQHDEAALVTMLDMIKVKNLDLVVASRYTDGHAVQGFQRSRARFSAWATKLTTTLVSATLTDPMSGFFVIRRTVFERLAPRLSSQGFKILLDIVATAHGRMRVGETPYVFRERLHGKSKFDGQVAVSYVALLLAKSTNDLISIRFLLFSSIGLSGVGVHMLALLIGLSIGGLSFTAAQVTATMLAISSNYLLNNMVTYSDLRLRGFGLLLGWVKFTLICSVGAISNVGVANWIYEHDRMWQIAGLAGAAVGVFWNFMVSSIYVWRLR
jgi:dolichol-phosphate mannosyltransferase